VQPILTDWALPSQDIHAVYCSPRLVPAKVSEFIAWLQGQFRPSWWTEVH
jgi:DNA-binding transcriptional LysR family regulator